MHVSTQEVPQVVPYADYEQLRADAEQILWQNREPAYEAKLMAPFVKLHDQSRLMIDGPRDSAFSWPTIVALEKNQLGISMNVEVVNGSIGRPLLFDRDEGEIISHYGDVSGGEYFNAFTLALDDFGGVALNGQQFSKRETKTLDAVNPQELITFGRAVLMAINIHEAKLYDQSSLTQS